MDPLKYTLEEPYTHSTFGKLALNNGAPLCVNPTLQALEMGAHTFVFAELAPSCVGKRNGVGGGGEGREQRYFTKGTEGVRDRIEREQKPFITIYRDYELTVEDSPDTQLWCRAIIQSKRCFQAV